MDEETLACANEYTRQSLEGKGAIEGKPGPAGKDGDGMPIGSIITFMGVKAPEHYLICDGSAYNIDDYPEFVKFLREQFTYKYKEWDSKKNAYSDTILTADGAYHFGDVYADDNKTIDKTKFRVPDLKEHFLRGAGSYQMHDNPDSVVEGNRSFLGDKYKGTYFPYQKYFCNKGGYNGIETSFDSRSNTNGTTSYGVQEFIGLDSTSAITFQAANYFDAGDNEDGSYKKYARPVYFIAQPNYVPVLYCIKVK